MVNSYFLIVAQTKGSLLLKNRLQYASLFRSKFARPAIPMKIYPIYPMAVAQRMIEANGGNIEELFERCQITQAEFSDPSTLLTAQQTNESINVFRDYSNKDRLTSVQFLQHMNFSDLGALGMAMTNSENMRQAFDSLLKYQAIYAPTFYIVETKNKDSSVFTIENDVSIGSNNNVVIEMVVGVFSLIKDLIQLDEVPLKVSLAHSKPQEVSKDDFPGLKISWGTKCNRVTISNTLMAEKIVGRNQANYTLFENILRQQLKDINSHMPYTRGTESCIHALMKAGVKVSLEEVSHSINISSRTLNRRLANENTTFKNLYTQQRLNHAAQLLKTSDMPIKRVATAAGYSALASFYKAFRAFHHASPDQFRNNH